LQTFNDVSVLINNKATTCCLDEMFYTPINPSRNPVKRFLRVYFYEIINNNDVFLIFNFNQI
jgi:hypothetical protein